MLKGKRANMGMTLFLGVIMFNIIMYFVIYGAAADSSFNSIGNNANLQSTINASTTENLDSTKVTHWYSGFQVSVFGMPWYVDVFYVTLQGLFLSLAIYAMIRGLN